MKATYGVLSLPVTTSTSQSLRPPGAASTAVWGLYTLIPSCARRKRVFCCVLSNVIDFNARNMMGSGSWLDHVREVIYIAFKRTVCDNHGIFSCNGFIGHSLREVDCQECRILQMPWPVRCFQQN
jgi:hypothetical protein